MISLQDQIQKFQKLVYNPQLQQFVTVDQMFVGGGITMESIIRQSNFVVEELKKMNSVFKNYCKLNQKVYDKITQHELNVHSQQAKLNSTVGSVDRKLDQGLKKIKDLHQDTLSQNKQSANALKNNLDPLRKQLAEKVDNSTFSAMVKKFLDQNQDQKEENGEEGEEHEVSGGNAGQGVSSDRAPNSPYPKKKGKVSYDQFYRFRQQLDAKMKTSNDQIVIVQRESFDSKALMIKYIPQINTLAADLNESKTSLYKLEMAQTDTVNDINKQISKVNLELNSRLNDQVWKDKFEGFNDKNIRPIVQRLEDSLKSISQKYEASKEENVNKFQQIDATCLKNKTEITITQRSVDNIKEELTEINHKIQVNRSQLDDSIQQVSIKLQALGQQTKKSLVSLTLKTDRDVKEIHTAINNLVKTTEEAVVKVVNKRFDFQLKMIDKSIRQNNQANRQTRIDVGLVEEEIKNMQNILAQKANFADIVHHIENKANKEDFKELQTRIHQTSQQVLSRQHQSLNTSIRCDRSQNNNNSNSRKVPSINKISNSKTLLGPQATHRSKDLDMDSGTKLFMCGMEGHLDTRKSWTQTTARRRNNKSSTPIVSDFML